MSDTTREALELSRLEFDPDGDDPISDVVCDAWADAAEAFRLTLPMEQSGLSEWTLRVQAAVRVLIEKLPYPPAPAAAPSPEQQRAARIERMKAAIEGECDGLAIDNAHAAAILDYVLGAAPEPQPVAESAAWRRVESLRLMSLRAIVAHAYGLTPALRKEVVALIDDALAAHPPAQAAAPEQAAAEHYASLNPLGGPAATFDGIADLIRAGDSVETAMRVYGVQWAASGVQAAAPAAEQAAQRCPCGDREASACPGEWEPGCDLGANEKFVKVAAPAGVVPLEWRTSWRVSQSLVEAARPIKPGHHPNGNRKPDDIWRTVLLSDLQELLHHAGWLAAPAPAPAAEQIPDEHPWNDRFK